MKYLYNIKEIRLSQASFSSQIIVFSLSKLDFQNFRKTYFKFIQNILLFKFFVQSGQITLNSEIYKIKLKYLQKSNVLYL